VHAILSQAAFSAILLESTDSHGKATNPKRGRLPGALRAVSMSTPPLGSRLATLAH
jgi:hypothetical protein